MNETNNQQQAGGRPLAAVLTPWLQTPTERPLTVVVEFAVRGAARYLSHAQLSRVWERACVRAGLPLAYSQGFNPHVRMSLPLPKSVGLATEVDVVCIQLSPPKDGSSELTATSLQDRLTQELTEGLVIQQLVLVEGKAVLYPEQVTYQIPCRVGARQREAINTVLQAETISMERRKGDRGQTKTIDLRPYIEDVAFVPPGLEVLCQINATGSIRIDEIQNIFRIDNTDLEDAITRTVVQWRARA